MTEHVRCDLCGDDNATPVAYGRRFDICTINVICKSCGLVYQNPRLSKRELDLFYNSDYRSLYSGSNEVPPPDFVQHQLKRGEEIFDFCRPWLKSYGLVLDVGAGPGGLLVPFREHGYQVFGVEPGPYGQWGQKNLRLNIDQGNFDDISEDSVYDLIIFSFVLEHVPSPKAQLAKAYSLLSQEGLVFVEVPNLRKIKGSLESYFSIAHLTYFTPTTLRAMLKSSGFSLLKIEAEREYSMRFLAIKSTRPCVLPDWHVTGDAPEELEAFLRRHAKRAYLASKVKLGATPMLKICEIVIANLLSDKISGRVSKICRRAWTRIWYGK